MLSSARMGLTLGRGLRQGHRQGQIQVLAPLLHQTLALKIVRNTWVLRRRVEPPLGVPKESPYVVGPFLREVMPSVEVKEEDQLYEIVEKRDSRKKPDIPVILLDYVENLGVAGDVVLVRPGTARMQLILPGKAVYASPENLDLYKELIANSKKVATGPSSAISCYTSNRLSKQVFSVTMNFEQTWTIEKWHIRASLRKAGVIVPEEAIELPTTPISGPDVPGKEGKAFAVFVTINGHERVPVKCILHHYGHPWSSYWHMGQKQPLLPQEQGELLAGLPFPDPPPQEEGDDDSL